MKHLNSILLLLMLLFVASCDLFEDDDTMGTGDCKVSKASFNIPNDPARGETDFVYNSIDRLTGILSSDWDQGSTPYKTRIQIDYSGDLVSTLSSYSTFMNDPEEQNFKYEFYYENGELDSVSFNGFNSFEYSDGYYLVEFESGKPKVIDRYNYDNFLSQVNHYSRSVLNWDNDNVSSMDVNVIASGSMSRYVYTYDSMKSPINILALSFFSGNYYALSKNNILKAEFYLNDALQDTDNFDYSYTDQGYPLTSQQLPGYPLYNYEYDCN